MTGGGRTRRGETNNALVVDLEFWYSPELVRRHVQEPEDDQIPESVTPILELLDVHDTKVTFAVLGLLAEKYPELVKSIFDRGHEIASHGYSHKMLYDLTEDEFEQEIVRSAGLLSAITGEKPVGFRAPSYSLDNSTRWALKILQRHGFRYDASVFPVRTQLYGVAGAPLRPYRPSLEDITTESNDTDIVEFPMTILDLGIRVPVAGGFYLRVLPAWFLKFALRRIESTRPLAIYIHPWETNSQTPRVNNISRFAKFVTYYGINKALEKLDYLLSEFSFRPIREVLAREGFI